VKLGKLLIAPQGSRTRSVRIPSLKDTYQGRSDGGGYIGIYTPKISNRFVHVWDINTCLEIGMTS